MMMVDILYPQLFWSVCFNNCFHAQGCKVDSWASVDIVVTSLYLGQPRVKISEQSACQQHRNLLT